MEQQPTRRDHSYAFLGAGAPTDESFDLIVLNRGAARHSSALFERLWNRARLRFAADGGANGLVRPADGTVAAAAISETSKTSVSSSQSSDRLPLSQHQDRTPTLVCGDLDSILPDVRARLEQHAGGAVPIVRSTCQDTTDLEKCLQFLLLSHRRVARTHPSLPQSAAGAASTHDEVALARAGAEAIVRRACFHEWDCSFEQAQAVENLAAAAADVFSGGQILAAPMAVLFGAFGGRFDQQMAALHSALKFRDKFSRIILISDDEVGEIVGGVGSDGCPVVHRLRVCRARQGPSCGLIPFAGAVSRISTSGFKWNLADQCLSFGQSISTSNEFGTADASSDDNDLTVTSINPLLFFSQLLPE